MWESKTRPQLIGACLSHLRNIGIDQIVVSDYGSTDGTLDILANERRAGDLLVELVDVSTVANYDTWSVRETALARSTGADWILFLDADEFWIPASGSLRGCRYLLEADILAVDRFNVALTALQRSAPPQTWLERHDHLLLFTTMPSHFKQYVENRPEVPFITLMPGGKVMARPPVVAGVAPGSHDVLERIGAPIHPAACGGRPADRSDAFYSTSGSRESSTTSERSWRRTPHVTTEISLGIGSDGRR